MEDTETGLSTLETGLELREDSLSEALDSTPPFQKKNDAKSCKIQRNYWYLEQIMQIKPSSIFFVFFETKNFYMSF